MDKPTDLTLMSELRDRLAKLSPQQRALILHLVTTPDYDLVMGNVSALRDITSELPAASVKSSVEWVRGQVQVATISFPFVKKASKASK